MLKLREIEDKIDGTLESLKPSVKKKFVYRFSDKEGGNLFDAVPSLNPPIITYYSRRILNYLAECSLSPDHEHKILFNITILPLGNYEVPKELIYKVNFNKEGLAKLFR